MDVVDAGNFVEVEDVIDAEDVVQRLLMQKQIKTLFSGRSKLIETKSFTFYLSTA